MEITKENNLVKEVYHGVLGGFHECLIFRANDTVVFGTTDIEEPRNVKMVLRCFETLSGLKINLQKNELCGVGTRTEFIE